ncbi:hypothetical protein Sango_2757000 [Sesamum angolense]|uniref:DUF4218 domain-containing protein n=1 Tax=Sesamum angolense TaxID=2727404 RepID=A0AAE1T9L6_9LAMI|nr:hypothetical protein Sango_2757000 [Sesamum angolense]
MVWCGSSLKGFYVEASVNETTKEDFRKLEKPKSAKDETFTMHATLMWTVNALPAYGIASRWSIAVLWGGKFVWKTRVHSICRTILCSTTLDVNKVQELKASVAIIFCNLEKIFLLLLFDSMEHLIVHLPYEVRVGGLVQYRWMYLFERSFPNELDGKYHPKDLIIEELVATQFKVWFKYCVKSDLNYIDNDLLKLHY